MRFFRPLLLAKLFYPDAVFRIRTSEKILYLTFDDGPDPGSTPLILEILEQKNAKAVFFCNGKAAEAYPALVGTIRKQGHMVGNHCYDHLNGWRTSNDRYCNEVDRASVFTSDRIFRPPYGRMKQQQYRLLRRKYKIFMWDLMSYDYDRNFGAQRTLNAVKSKMRPGSVIVFHDKPSSSSFLMLRDFLEFSAARGYRFDIPAF
ncbi:MAG: Peptidoglycan-N-acetylglucosamine deacetylase [Bacteroidetes bacterium ADurb.Bin145]|nr:MAG: Peptidoglycan-N-acetylglucosamine deacetylase [Bacteroidetes bacterium ADurb.Bin145]